MNGLLQSPNPFSRRDMLKSLGCGFGYLAAAGLANHQATAGISNPLASRQPHFAPRAKRVIFLFMQGGPSHVDSFDYKPRLENENGELVTFDDARTLAKTGEITKHRVFKNMWDFQQYGQSGLPVSDLFPHIARHVDDICFLKGMHTDGVAHGPSTLFMHTGSINLIRPSVGSWVLYGLGSENENLPGFVTIQPSMGNGGPRNYSNAFLPAVYQGTAIGRAGVKAEEAKIRNLINKDLSAGTQREQFDLLRALNGEQLSKRPGDRELEAVINSYELAWRMQHNAPEIMDLSDEPEHIKKLYGIGEKGTDDFGRECLMARRMAEAGVRFIQVNYGDNTNNPRWDQHSNLPKHKEHAFNTDQPVAGLLTDLKQRGLLKDTLVWWGGEFGRTPYAQSNGTGRDHNSYGFTIWLAGGGVKPGFSYGETDEYGHHAVQNKIHMHDWHATMLHILGMDHEKLTFHYDGRPFRLTDVHGEVAKEILS
ncbi:MAG: sulfatase [Verrucomicrobiales bacterium]|nr:sulfatase [Verrucomicrobiales bacterium]|tara:strand:- start:5409 stop:6848 length:1440 start_codon:yes stop_codon:yes gene_type:complete